MSFMRNDEQTRHGFPPMGKRKPYTEAEEIVRKIDARMGSGWAKELAQALDPDGTWPAPSQEK